MARSDAFLRPPGHAATTYRSDVTAFRTAKVPEASIAARRAVASTRGADPLGVRPRQWQQTTYVNQHVFTRAKASDALLATAPGKFAPSRSQRTLTDGALLKSTWGTKSVAFAKEPFEGDWCARTNLESHGLGNALDRDRETGLRRVTARAKKHSDRVTNETLRRSGKVYVNPMDAERERMATMRDAKARGEWPRARSPVRVRECTRRSKTRRADLQAVLYLEKFERRVVYGIV